MQRQDDQFGVERAPGFPDGSEDPGVGDQVRRIGKERGGSKKVMNQITEQKQTWIKG